MLDRASSILDAFTTSGRALLTLSEIARHTGLPKATVHRLLGALQQIGWVERTPEGHQLGVRLFEIGQHVPRKAQVREAALPFMQDLYESTHETIHLAVLDGRDVVYLERIHGHEPLRIPSRVGGRLPAHSTGVGKALLAFDDDATQVVLARRLTAHTPYTIVAPHVLKRQLAEIRSQGVAYDREENSLGITCAAAPIVLDGVAIAAVSVTGPTSRLRVERLATAVRTAALGIQRTLRP